MSIFSEIKKHAAEGKSPTLPEQRYLIDVIDNIDRMGCSKEDAIKYTQIIPVNRGKKTTKYQAAKHARDLKLAKAVSLLEGTDWGRCVELMSIIKDVIQRYKHVTEFEPQSELERLVVRSIKTGLKTPSTVRGLHKTIFANN